MATITTTTRIIEVKGTRTEVFNSFDRPWGEVTEIGESYKYEGTDELKKVPWENKIWLNTAHIIEISD